MRWILAMRGFCLRLILASRERLRAKERTIFATMLQSGPKILSQPRKKGHPKRCPFVAGIDGFGPSKCQSQSLVPYRLAISQFFTTDKLYHKKIHMSRDISYIFHSFFMNIVLYKYLQKQKNMV